MGAVTVCPACAEVARRAGLSGAGQFRAAWAKERRGAIWTLLKVAVILAVLAAIALAGQRIGRNIWRDFERKQAAKIRKAEEAKRQPQPPPPPAPQ
jgi:flagellar basal body-associated protein FliL